MKTAGKRAGSGARRRKTAATGPVKGQNAKLLRMVLRHFGTAMTMALCRRLGYEAC